MIKLGKGQKEVVARSTDLFQTDWLEQSTVNQLAIHLLQVRETERKLLANDIHDKLGQNLLALRIDVSMLHTRTVDTHPRINSKAVTVLNDLDITIQNVRDIINYLRPPVLELGLLASVEWELSKFEKHSKIPSSLRVIGSDSDYSVYDSRAVPVMRILQESLTNIERHANASMVDVTLSNIERHLIINILDDGVGIHPDDLRKPKAFGLLGVKEYVRMLNGDFSIGRNAVKTGTMLSVAIPDESTN